MNTSAAIIVGALILGASYVVANRYMAAPADTHDPKLQVLWVINRITGKVTRCEGSLKVTCVDEDLHFRP
jgi:hypothetical protein